MRSWHSVPIGLAILFGSPLAFAQPTQGAPDEEEEVNKDKPPEPADQPAEGGQGVSGAILLDDSGRNIGVARKGPPPPKKAWTVGGVFETHRMIRQDDLQGQARSRAMNFLYLFGGYGLSNYDRIQFRTGVFQRFIGDQGETGIRMDDFEPMYTRIIPLPWKLTARTSGSVILPTSYESQRADLYCAPRILTQLDRRFGTLNITFRNSNAVWLHKYKASPGGDALPLFSISGSLNAEYAMPFHEQLSVGIIGFSGATFNHDPTNGDDPNVKRFGAVNDPQYGNTQPVQNSYGGEVYVRYILPEVTGVKSDFTIGYANGDYAVGYMRGNRDGVNRVYGFWRTNAEVYAELGIRY
jgi:hypothetical protein